MNNFDGRLKACHTVQSIKSGPVRIYRQVMRKIMFLFFILLLQLTGLAQQNILIRGVVKNDKGSPQGGSTILLQRVKDSSIVKTALSEQDGQYEFPNIPAGHYFITVSSVGYRTMSTAPLAVQEGQAFEAPPVSLQVSSKKLDDVVVRAGKPLMVVKLDRIVLNVENSINSVGSNALELLEKSPGVVIDREDNISFKGKSGVRIYIDGRPTQMDSKSLAALLRGMNSADIESIEFITNPSAKFEASGSGGVINIRLKKDSRYGFNGNFSTGINFARTPKQNNSISGNYRNKGLNFFGNYSNSFGTNQSDINMYRIQADSIYDSRSIQRNNATIHNFKAGVDFTPNARSVFGVMVTGNLGDGSINSYSTTPIYAVNTGSLYRTLVASNLMPDNRKTFNYNANYRFADTLGRELNIDADYGTFRAVTSSYQPNVYEYVNGTSLEINYRNQTDVDIDILSLRMDYEHNMMGGRLGYGFKVSDVRTRNRFDFWNIKGSGEELDIDLTNRFSYKENVNAAYANYRRPLNSKWDFQAGLRVENTRSEGDLTSYKPPKPEDNVKRNYTDLFPSAALSYTLNSNNQFSFNYSRRIERPSYQDLNPFETRLDELNYQKGNSFLRPQYANGVEISHIFKNMVTTSLGFSHVKDMVADITDTSDRTKAFFISRNLASQNVVSLNVNAQLPVTKWWRIFANVNANYSHYKGTLDGGIFVDVSGTNFTFWTQNSFSIAKGLTAQLNNWYSSPFIWGGTYRNRHMGGFDIGVQKSILKNAGSVRLTLTDVAYTMRWSGVTTVAGRYIDANGGRESQQLRVYFSYRFGKSTVKSARSRKGGLEEEKDRIKASSAGGLGG